jgi:hypothetical protein
MGNYINTGNALFRISRNSRIYVDKSMLISLTNGFLGDEFRFLCISRPRRFGKSMAANMLCAYYDESCDSRELFNGLKIEDDPSFSEPLNKYPVIHLDIAGFITTTKEKKGIAGKLNDILLKELRTAYPDIVDSEEDVFALAISHVYQKTGKQFVFVIDEWDALFREFPNDTGEQDAYINFLRSLFKNSSVGPSIALAYMTGILPIKKYNTQSALNNFKEYSMLSPAKFAPFVGFTEDEVEALCKKYDMDFDEMKKWYDGYSFPPNLSIYSPYSVVNALADGIIQNYWTETSAADDAKDYINMGFDGLKEDITRMMAGEPCPVNVRNFENDFVTLHDKDQVMTLLIHLGYLAYDQKEKKACIPNLEVSEKLSDSIIASNWSFSSKALHDSKKLLKATWDGKEDVVAKMVESTHDQLSSFMSYNQESDLTLVISLAYYAAREYYHVKRELPSGHGYADVAFVPRKGCSVLPMIVELKWERISDDAVAQIYKKKYLDAFRSEYKEALVCGINYGASNKEHTCRIERVTLR